MRVNVFAVLMLSVWCLFGIYRFMAVRATARTLALQLSAGLVGGLLALATWGAALQRLGSDAAHYRPHGLSLWPLVAALMASMATFDWKDDHEH